MKFCKYFSLNFIGLCEVFKILCSILMVDKRFFDAIESTDTKLFRYLSKFLNYSAGYIFFFEFADLNNECLENI